MNERNYTRAGQFPDTPWTQVRMAGGQDTKAHDSLEVLCRLYWAPLYAYARRHDMHPAEAEDVTQAFFAHLLEDDTIKNADSEKGRLRSYLLGAMKRFISNWRRAEMTAKRGGRLQRVDFDTTEVEAVCAQQGDGLSPDAFFERRWAVALLDHALKDLEQEQANSGKGEQFAVLSEFLLVHGKDAQHADAAVKLGMSEGTVRVAVHRLRKRFRERVREHVTATVGSAADVDDELRHLMSLYGN
ncbi:MAG: RNA polymerase sigma factor [Prosthecobacter sp.]|uniref:RNA polymerase sigma factor n=1 Tax=Prosthecobacter sp. TaxID=1965333 RepID=UPI003900EFDF